MFFFVMPAMRWAGLRNICLMQQGVHIADANKNIRSIATRVPSIADTREPRSKGEFVYVPCPQEPFNPRPIHSLSQFA